MLRYALATYRQYQAFSHKMFAISDRSIYAVKAPLTNRLGSGELRRRRWRARAWAASP